MAEVTMSLEEYLELTRSNSLPPRAKVSKAKKRQGKPNPKLARALKEANKKARKKDGSFKKGYSQSRVMKMAHASLKRKGRK